MILNIVDHPNTANPVSSNIGEHDYNTNKSDILKEDALLVLEIRNPLTTIALSIEMIRAGLNEEDLITYTGIVKRGLQRIHQLVDLLVERRRIPGDAL